MYRTQQKPNSSICCSLTEYGKPRNFTTYDIPELLVLRIAPLASLGCAKEKDRLTLILIKQLMSEIKFTIIQSQLRLRTKAYAKRPPSCLLCPMKQTFSLIKPSVYMKYNGMEQGRKMQLCKNSYNY
uniref:Uncharacterized protein n=1 Tax=Glossina pallidipes TaxID=7398 RepID=A0A1A9ZUI8_GLOPL